jgi:hypothetical protein
MHVLKSTDGACSRILICRSGFISGYWMIDALADAEPSWTIPWVGIVLGDSGSATTMPLIGSLAAVSSLAYTYVPAFAGIPANAAAVYFGSQYPRQFAAALYSQVVANDIGASWFIGDMCVYSERSNSWGWIGKVIDQWWTSTALVDSDTFPVAGPTRNFAVFGDIVLPWNTTAVTIGGGVSTARDGEHAGWDYYSTEHLTPVMSSPYGTADTVPIAPAGVTLSYYIMQANDSVTGVRYDWTVPSAPDWAAVGYPGPNAATNVAIAGMLQ